MKNKKEPIQIALFFLGLGFIILSHDIASFIFIDIIGFYLLKLDFNPFIAEIIFQGLFFIIGMLLIGLAIKFFSDDQND